MAELTKAQILALFQVLEVPYTTKAAQVIGDGLVAQPKDVTGSSRAAKTMIVAHLENEVYPDAEATAVLAALLTSWIDLGEETIFLEQGSVGNVTGINTNTPQTREEIRRKVLIQVPYFRAHEELMRSHGCTISVIR